MTLERALPALVFLVLAPAACSKTQGTVADAGSSTSEPSTNVKADAAKAPRKGDDARSRWSVAHALATGPKCGIDEVVHRVRGSPRATESTCPTSPAQLDVIPGRSPQPSALFYYDRFPEDDAELARRGYPGFVFEGDLNEEFGKSDRDCHYVGCTKIRVAKTGVPTPGGKSCLGPLTGGTSAPAASEPSCPAAVMIAGVYRPFVQMQERGAHGDGGPAACCYAVPPPTPPALP